MTPNFWLCLLVVFSSTFSLTVFSFSTLGKLIVILSQTFVLFLVSQNRFSFSFKDYLFLFIIVFLILIGGFSHEKPLLTVFKSLQYGLYFLFCTFFSRNFFTFGKSTPNYIFIIISLLTCFYLTFQFPNIGLDNRFKGYFFDSNYWAIFLILFYYWIDRLSLVHDFFKKFTLFCIFLTFSLSGYIIISLYFVFKRVSFGKSTTLLLSSLIVLLPPLMGFLFFGDVLDNVSQYRSSLSGNTDFIFYKLASIVNRIDVNYIVVRHLSIDWSVLFSGYGYGVVHNYLPRATHTAVFQILFSSGLLGLTSFLIILLTSFSSVLRHNNISYTSAAILSYLPSIYMIDTVFTGLLLLLIFFLRSFPSRKYEYS